MRARLAAGTGCLVLGLAVGGCATKTKPVDCQPPEPPRAAPAQPTTPDQQRELKAVLYRNATLLLQLERYDDSYRSFALLVKLDPRYQDAAGLLVQARQRMVQRHYQEGLRLYREERLEEAIAQWRLALRYDPRHTDARKGIEQAEVLLRKLKDTSK